MDSDKDTSDYRDSDNHGHESGADPTHSSTGNTTEKHQSKRSQNLKDLLSITGVFITALAIAVVLVSFVFQSYQVDGPSMETTLNNNDHLIVWKVPRTIAKITHHDYIPNRGDVIIFNEDLSAYGEASSKQLVKRVIGLPGDRIVVKNGKLSVYNLQHPDGFSPDATMPYGGVIKNTPGNIDVTIKPGQLYACGDNRPLSLDSRTFGPINANQVVGKLVARVLPIKGFKAF